MKSSSRWKKTEHPQPTTSTFPMAFPNGSFERTLIWSPALLPPCLCYRTLKHASHLFHGWWNSLQDSSRSSSQLDVSCSASGIDRTCQKGNHSAGFSIWDWWYCGPGINSLKRKEKLTRSAQLSYSFSIASTPLTQFCQRILIPFYRNNSWVQRLPVCQESRGEL